MSSFSKNDLFDAAAIAPVHFGTPEMEQLIAAIGESAAASKAVEENPFAAIDLVRASRLGALRVPGGRRWWLQCTRVFRHAFGPCRGGLGCRTNLARALLVR